MKQGYEAIAQRMTNAEEALVSLIAEAGELDAEDANKVAALYIDKRIVKLDPVMGRYTASHGDFWTKEVIHRALAMFSG